MSSTRLYVGRLSRRATERDVEHLFKSYGKVRDLVMKEGFAFVELDDSRDADDAIYDLNGTEFMGDRVIIEKTKRGPGSSWNGDRRGGGGYGGGGGFGRGGPPQRRNAPWLSRYGAPEKTKYRVVLENLSTKYSWQDIKDMCRDYGYDVSYADAHRDKKNEALLCFQRHSDVKKCVEKFDGKEMNGRKVKAIDDSRLSTSRSRSRSGSRSRSPRSRSRSGSGRRSKSHSRSRSPKSRSRSPSGSPAANGNDPSRSPSPNKSRSASPAPKQETADSGSEHGGD